MTAGHPDPYEPGESAARAAGVPDPYEPGESAARAAGVPDPREHALGLAWRALNRRERTEAELARILVDKGVDEALAADVVDELREGGFVDDAGYARRFAEDRRSLDGWGSARIEQRLRGLGVGREQIAAALAGRDGDEELEAAVALLERRFPASLDAPRDRERALGMLVRRGYELDLAHDAIRRRAA